MPLSLSFLHARLGWTLVLLAVVLTVWGLWRYGRGQEVSADYMGALVLSEIVAVLIGLLGLALAARAGLPGRWIHILYGLLVVAVWPGVFVYLQGARDRRAMLLYALASLFILGLALRAIGTG